MALPLHWLGSTDRSRIARAKSVGFPDAAQFGGAHRAGSSSIAPGTPERVEVSQAADPGPGCAPRSDATSRAPKTPADGAGGRDSTVAKEDRGFASMDRAKQREIASKGGKAAHQKGTAHEWTSEEARDAGRKGGLASHRRRREQLLASGEQSSSDAQEDRGEVSGDRASFDQDRGTEPSNE